MKGNVNKKLIASVMGAAMTLSAASSAVHAVSPANLTLSNNKNASTEGKVVYELGFEDEADLKNWSNRGGDDTTKVSLSADAAKSGKSGLAATGRSESWNGPAFRLDGVLEPNTQYYISASVKGKYYTSAMFSFQYTIDGQTSYSNLVQNINGGDWQSIKNVPVSYSDGMEGVYVYFEGGSDDLYIDDFKVVEAPSVDIEKDLPSLSEIYKDKFKIGTALTPDDLASKPFMDLVQKHFGESITVGNQMKPDYVLNEAATKKYLEETGDDETPQISFSQAKPVLNYANKYGIPVRVHTLVWHSQTPEWFFKEDYDAKKDYVSPDKMKKRMENYIKSYFETLTKLYPNIDFYACDVVNEAWQNDGTPRKAGHCGQSNNYEASDWVAVFGDNSFIDYAFEYARKYAPKGCKLYYNDFNEYMDKKDAICKMAERLKKAGNIDGIGMQSHLDARESLQAAFPSLSMYETAIKQYAALGLDIQITELDATVQDRSGSKYFDVQAQYYKGLFDLYEKYSDKISAVIFWGVTDTKSWRASQNPLIFDGDFMAKPAFKSIVGSKTASDPVRTTRPDSGTVVTTTTTVTTKPVTNAKLVGDANNDGGVDMADVVLIMQSLANPNKYGLNGSDEHCLTLQGAANADVPRTSKGITNEDALAIQEYLLGKIDDLNAVKVY